MDRKKKLIFGTLTLESLMFFSSISSLLTVNSHLADTLLLWQLLTSHGSGSPDKEQPTATITYTNGGQQDVYVS